VDRSSRRQGQFLVVVGALLGVLVGTYLGMAVDVPEASVAAAAPARARGSDESASA
jgi:hypothetical protein